MKTLPRNSNLRAETLLEVIVAVSILGFMLIQAGQTRVRSIREAEFLRNNLIAELLAEEGVESVRGMVLTNFLRFSAKRNTCWDTLPDLGPSRPPITIANCDAAGNRIRDRVANGKRWFTLERNLGTLAWTLVDATPPKVDGLPTQSVGSPPPLNVDNLSQYRLRSDVPAENLQAPPPANQPNTGLYFAARQVEAPRGVITNFYRDLSIELIGVPGSGNVDGLRVASRVIFPVGGTWYQVYEFDNLDKNGID